MGDQREGGIAWTNATWNPTTGCTKVSQGCKFCYAERVFPRAYAGQTVLAYNPDGSPFTRRREFTDVQCHPERLDQPLRWQKPRRIFVNSMSDLFHEAVPDEFIDQVFAVMADAGQHNFQILTKRPERMEMFMRRLQYARIKVGLTHLGGVNGPSEFPFPNVQLGVSCEDQETADERIPLLLQTPAAVRFISAEPLLGAIHFPLPCKGSVFWSGIDWVIVGGESGPKARPMHPDWARSLRDQCVAAGVPFFFKQWGEWTPITVAEHAEEYSEAIQTDDWREVHKQKLLNFATGEHSAQELPIGATPYMGREYVKRVGKKKAGAMLDGREWREYPITLPQEKKRGAPGLPG